MQILIDIPKYLLIFLWREYPQNTFFKPNDREHLFIIFSAIQDEIQISIDNHEYLVLLLIKY